MATDPVRPQTVQECEAALAAYFPPEVIRWKPRDAAKSPGKVTVMPYIDVRAVCDRLDSVFGADRWETAFRELSGGNIECTLRVCFPGPADRWVQRVDVGSRSKHMQDPDDNLKTAYSDALKRAAVQLGIGRYLYRMGTTQADWDGRRVTGRVIIPDHFLPPDCREAGPELADRAVKLVGAWAERVGKASGPLIAKHLRENDIDPQTPLSGCEVRVVQSLIQRTTRAMEALAKISPPAAPIDPAPKPAPLPTETQRILDAVRRRPTND